VAEEEARVRTLGTKGGAVEGSIVAFPEGVGRVRGSINAIAAVFNLRSGEESNKELVPKFKDIYSVNALDEIIALLAREISNASLSIISAVDIEEHCKKLKKSANTK
jgi:uncharacterized small protein (DUF1192 family)